MKATMEPTAIRSPEGGRAALALTILAVGLCLQLLTPAATPFDSPLRFARSVVQGRSSLPLEIPRGAERTFRESYVHENRRYPGYQPLVSLSLVPIAALGLDVLGQPRWNSLLITAAAALVGLCVRRIRRIRTMAPLAVVAFALGTPFLHGAAAGTVWQLMHAQCAVFLSAALLVALTRGVGAASGFAFALAAGCRPANAPSVLAFALLADPGSGAEARLRVAATRMIRFLAGALPVAALTAAAQWRMTGNPLMSPYVLYWADRGFPQSFSFSYVTSNLHSYLFAMPTFLDEFPFVRFDDLGQAFWVVSPFFLGLPFCWRDALGRRLVLGVVPTFGLLLLHYGNGWRQFGARYLLDLAPFLLPAAFIGLRPWTRSGRAALVAGVAAAVAIEAFGLWLSVHHPPPFTVYANPR